MLEEEADHIVEAAAAVAVRMAAAVAAPLAEAASPTATTGSPAVRATGSKASRQRLLRLPRLPGATPRCGAAGACLPLCCLLRTCWLTSVRGLPQIVNNNYVTVNNGTANLNKCACAACAAVVHLRSTPLLPALFTALRLLLALRSNNVVTSQSAPPQQGNQQQQQQQQQQQGPQQQGGNG